MSGFSNEAFTQRWASMGLMEQLGNIGSEVERAIAWKRRSNSILAEKAFDRTLQLLDLTIGDVRWKGGKRKELCRMRETLCDALYGENNYNTSDEFLSKYFLQCAVAARKVQTIPIP